MSPISFVPKASFMLFDRVLKILGVRKNDGRTELEVIDEDGVVHVHSQDYLFDQYSKRNLRAADFVKEDAKSLSMATPPAHMLLSDLSEGDRQEGEKNAHLLQAINEEGGFHRGNSSFWERRYPGLCKELGFLRVPDRSTIQRWVQKAQSCIGAPLQLILAPKNGRKGGRGKIRMSEEVQKIVETCVQDVYLSSENTPLQECHDELQKRITHANEFRLKHNKLKLISYGQLRRYVLGIDAYEIHASKFGRASAEKKFKISRKSARRIRRALERAEIDHTPLDIFVVDDNGEVLGRAYLTVVVDKKTKAILGFNLGFEGPSTISVLRALKHAVSPKTYLQERFPEVENDWPMFGLIELLAMDNGPEFHSPAFKMTVLNMAIAREFAYMPTGKPYFKGQVEQLQGYLNRSISSGQPGATMSHHEQRNKERPPEEYAVHTLDSLHRMLHIWICDVYHQKVQAALGTSPYKAWVEATSQMPVRLPASKEHLDLACTLPITRKLQAYGVEICYLRTFNNDELGRLMRRYMHAGTITVEVRYKPSKLDKVWVKDPDTKTWFVVENYDSETRTTTAWQQEQAQKLIRDQKNEHGTVISRAQAQAKLRAIGTELLKAKTMSQRRRALKILGLLPTTDQEIETVGKVQSPKARKTDVADAVSKVTASKAAHKRLGSPPASSSKLVPVRGGYHAVEAHRVI